MRSHYHRAIARLDAALTGVGESELDLKDAEEPEEAFVIVSPVHGVRYKIKVWIKFDTGKDLENKVKDKMGLPRDATVKLLLGGKPIRPEIQLAEQGIVNKTKLEAENPVEALVIVSTLDGGEYEIWVWDGFETGKNLANEVKDKMGLRDHRKVKLFLGDEPIKPNVQLATQGIVDGTELELAAIVSTDKALHDETIKDAIAKWMDPKTRQSVVDEYGDIGDWNTSQVTDMSRLFDQAQSFNKDISQWDTSEVKDMNNMFSGAQSFNQPLEAWDVSSVTNMRAMFLCAESFNQPLEAWDVSKVEDMQSMFAFASSFKQPLEAWNVSNVTNMRAMFSYAESFNQPLNAWGKEVGNVENMDSMFTHAHKFNQPLEEWDVSSVKYMNYMFFDAHAFNQPLEEWNVSTVTNMRRMFNQEKSLDHLPMWYDSGKNNWSLREE